MVLPGFFIHAKSIGYRPMWFAAILILNLFAVLFEGIGIGAVLPILEFIQAGGDISTKSAESKLWATLENFSETFHIPLNLLTLLSLAFLAICIRQLFLYLRDLATGWIQYELVRMVRNQGFHHFLYANLGYHDNIRAGDFVNELTTELLQGVSAVTSAANFAGTLILIFGYVTLSFLLSPSLTLTAIFVLLTISLILIRLMSSIQDLGREVTRTNQDTSSFLVERLKAVRLVRLSGVEEAEEAALRQNTQAQANKLFQQRKMLALLSVLIEPIALFVTFGLLFVSVTHLQLGFETIILFFFILVRLVPIVKQAVLQRHGYLAQLGSLEAIERRLSGLAFARDDAGGTKKFHRLDANIKLDCVSYEYDSESNGRKKALDNVSFEIPAGRTTALVGPSGAGKSTLVDLLPRLRRPTSGCIFFDGSPQDEFNSASLRQAVSFAPQFPQIFNVTCAQHIRYGWPNAKTEDVVAAARIAQADSFIQELPRGYDTQLGEGGERLSGGQRQRLDLARALVRQAPILVLDEPTSNLDAEAEQMFRTALDRIRQETNITIIIIAHRLSTVIGADQIVVLKDGCVQEIGNHADLLRRGGWYATAFGSQFDTNDKVQAIS